MPKPGGQQLARLFADSASTHHSSARVTSMVAWNVFGTEAGCAGARL